MAGASAWYSAKMAFLTAVANKSSMFVPIRNKVIKPLLSAVLSGIWCTCCQRMPRWKWIPRLRPPPNTCVYMIFIAVNFANLLQYIFISGVSGRVIRYCNENAHGKIVKDVRGWAVTIHFVALKKTLRMLNQTIDINYASRNIYASDYCDSVTELN